MITIHFELSDQKAFDDLVNLDCIAECMQERIKDSDSWEDQKAMRQWMKTLYKLRNAYENVVIVPESLIAP